MTTKAYGKGKIWPPPPLNPLTDHRQNFVVNYVGNTYHSGKFYPNWIRGFIFAQARLRAPKCLLGYFWVFPLTYSQLSQDANTDIDAKYVKRRGSALGCALSGSQNHNLIFAPSLSPKTAILCPILTVLISPEIGYSIGRAPCKRRLNVIVAP